MPVLLLGLIFTWALVSSKKMNKGQGLLVSIILVVFIYLFSIAYRINMEVYIKRNYNNMASVTLTKIEKNMRRVSPISLRQCWQLLVLLLDQIGVAIPRLHPARSAHNCCPE